MDQCGAAVKNKQNETKRCTIHYDNRRRWAMPNAKWSAARTGGNIPYALPRRGVVDEEGVATSHDGATNHDESTVWTGHRRGAVRSGWHDTHKPHSQPSASHSAPSGSVLIHIGAALLTRVRTDGG